MTVDIVMATFNGERYLPEQLASLQWQTHTDWRLYACDDASTDDTLKILCGFETASGMPPVEKAPHRGGACERFAKLLRQATAPYVMCCDQDDIWFPHKIEVTLRAMRHAELIYGRGVPILVHADAAIVGDAYHPSFARYHGYRPDKPSFARLLVQNCVHGCTLMANRALLDKALPIPPGARAHDMWLALTAAAFGKLIFIPGATMLYRQHGGNAIGARQLSMAGLRGNAGRVMRENIRQAECFYARYADAMRVEHEVALAAFCSNKGAALTCMYHGILRRPLYQNIPMFLFS